MGKVTGKSNCPSIIRKKMAEMRIQGINKENIAKMLGCSSRTVQRYWQKSVKHSFSDKHRSGRPQVLSAVSKMFITNNVKDKWGSSTRSCTKKLNSSKYLTERNQTVSRSTVRRFIVNKSWGKIAYKKPIKPLLTDKNIQDRLTFCDWLEEHGYLQNDFRGRHKRAHILWSDESPIDLYPAPNRQNMRIRTSDKENISPAQRPKFGLKIMVAGGMTRNGLTRLVIIDEKQTVDSHYYVNAILPVYQEACNRVASGHKTDEKKLLSLKEDLLFQQDGAPSHRSKVAQQFCETHFANFIPSSIWPGNSPDLNVIEHIWARLQDSVFISPMPKNRMELIARVQETWSSLDVNYLAALADSLPNRVAAVRGAEGRHTDY
jgi:transposase